MNGVNWHANELEQTKTVLRSRAAKTVDNWVIGRPVIENIAVTTTVNGSFMPKHLSSMPDCYISISKAFWIYMPVDTSLEHISEDRKIYGHLSHFRWRKTCS